MKIKFKPSNSDFFKELNIEVSNILTENVIAKGKRILRAKFLFYLSIFITLYGFLYTDFVSRNFTLLIFNYSLLGLSGILLAFNASHDAVHNTLFSNKKLNRIAHYLIFNLQGVNASLWKKRHVSSHHIFPNVDGCDADIDNNPFIRLTGSHKAKGIHKFQHLYASILYSFYTLHWIFIKDFIYITKKEVANMKDLTYSKKFVVEVILLKLFYLIYIVVLPLCFTESTLTEILLSFIIMHGFISIFFVLTLIISHLTMETNFPKVDKIGFLPTCYHEHQLSVSLDYHPTNKVANWIFGGFNAHAAHHLFPNLPHTLYTVITPTIKEMAIKFSMPYNELSIMNAVRSHFEYLKQLGKTNSLHI
ncbi:MAG: acyl-CoA desaturase [Flavobacteriales bacterium]|nr:acyl-CoA desaturase [Flavobacteriales bacterium]